MRIAIGADHRGKPLKERLKALLREEGHEVTDVGTDGCDSVDYPDYALPVARGVASGEYERGILICGSGIGMSIAANKVRGIRAALCLSPKAAELSRKHNNANVLCLGAEFLTPEQAEEITKVWLRTEFEGGRHARRLNKIAEAENEGR